MHQYSWHPNLKSDMKRLCTRGGMRTGCQTLYSRVQQHNATLRGLPQILWIESELPNSTARDQPVSGLNKHVMNKPLSTCPINASVDVAQLCSLKLKQMVHTPGEIHILRHAPVGHTIPTNYLKARCCGLRCLDRMLFACANMGMCATHQGFLGNDGALISATHVASCNMHHLISLALYKANVLSATPCYL